MLNLRAPVFVLASLGLFMLGDYAVAAEAIGYVRVLRGDAKLVQAGQETQAAMAAPVTQGSLIRTGPGASLGIIFKDNTVMALGPATEISIDNYLYSPSQGRFKLDATLSKGTLAYLSGAIAKQNPEGVLLKTPTGAIGVRGSHFAIKVDDR
ncbi:MAG: FecR family protein [Gallionellaceae bacterium]|nr:FecR family protein [Gallionellaceae bacterium]